MSINGVKRSDSEKIRFLETKLFDVLTLEKLNLAEAWSAICGAYNRYEDKVVPDLKPKMQCTNEGCLL